MNEMKTSEVLDLAADKIQEHGWGQGSETWTPRAGRGICLEGGIIAALGVQRVDLYTSCPAYQAMSEYLDAKGFLFFWNDEPGRTKEEVIEVLRAAAMVERTKEAAAGYDTEDQPLPIEARVA